MKKLAACILAATIVAPSVQAFSEDEILIWLGGDKAYQGLIDIGKQFEEDAGIKVVVQNPEDVTDRFQQAASTGQGPDIMFWAHDRLGGWADAGLLSTLEPSESFKAQFTEMGWDAMSHNGEVYGYPVSLEAISLLYNKDIISEAPETFEEMFSLNEKLAKDDINTIIWAQTDPYFTAPFLTANGGYVFKQDDGIYNVSETGINNEGAKKGAKLLTEMLDEDVSPRGADFSIAEARFAQNKSAMIIAGPWSWSNFDRVNMNYGVAPLPSIDGNPAKPFVGVWGAMVNNASPNVDVVQEFMEQYVMTLEGLQILNRDVPLGVVAHHEFMDELRADPRIAASADSVDNGLLMPSVPEMGRFWASFTAALENIVAGREPYDEALDRAARYIVNQS